MKELKINEVVMINGSFYKVNLKRFMTTTREGNKEGFSPNLVKIKSEDIKGLILNKSKSNPQKSEDIKGSR